MKKARKYPELNMLKGKIREQNTSYRKVAKAINMSTNTLSDKINGYYIFGIDEVGNLAEILNITPQEIPKYFFPQMLRNATQNIQKVS